MSTSDQEVERRRGEFNEQEEAEFRKIFDHFPDEWDELEIRADIAQVIQDLDDKYQRSVDLRDGVPLLPFTDRDDIELAIDLHRQCRDSLLRALLYAVVFEWDTEDHSYATRYDQVEADPSSEAHL